MLLVGWLGCNILGSVFVGYCVVCTVFLCYYILYVYSEYYFQCSFSAGSGGEVKVNCDIECSLVLILVITFSGCELVWLWLAEYFLSVM